MLKEIIWFGTVGVKAVDDYTYSTPQPTWDLLEL